MDVLVENIFKQILAISVMYVWLGIMGLLMKNMGTYALVQGIFERNDGLSDISILYIHNGEYKNNIVIGSLINPEDFIIPVAYSLMTPEMIYIGYPIIDIDLVIHLLYYGYMGIIYTSGYLFRNECMSLNLVPC